MVVYSSFYVLQLVLDQFFKKREIEFNYHKILWKYVFLLLRYYIEYSSPASAQTIFQKVA